MANVTNTAYRVATDVPWATDDQVLDWGRRYDRESEAIDEVIRRARKHLGAGFVLRERAGEDWGRVNTITELDNRMNKRMGKDFGPGDMLHVKSLSDGVKWHVRAVFVKPELVQTAGDAHVDWAYSILAKQSGFESWGICNPRNIAGTSTPSMHWPRGVPCTARALDGHAGSLERMKELANMVNDPAHCGKILLAGAEWLPDGGGWRFVGSFIDHFDHFHWESRDASGSLCRSC